MSLLKIDRRQPMSGEFYESHDISRICNEDINTRGHRCVSRNKARNRTKRRILLTDTIFTLKFPGIVTRR